jgi:ATP-dependent DNA helicase RecG
MRLPDEALLELFHSPENERLERKETLTGQDSICQAICAFANDLAASGEPGVVIIGQKDDLSCASLSIDAKLLEKIGGWRSTGKFHPFPAMSVERREIEGCPVAVITVAPSLNTPVRYEDRIWIRVGPRRGTASAEEERRLIEKRRLQDLPFDARIVQGASLKDIDLVRFALEYLPSAVPSDILAENDRSQEQQMQALRLLDAQWTPTVTAILLLGKSPQDFFPGSYIQVLRIDGEKLTDPVIDQHELTGVLSDQLRRIDEIAELWIKTASLVGGTSRADIPDYPLAALRQIFRNAVMHRNYEGTNAPIRVTWYNDRIETQSPGGLYGQVTPETFGRPGVTDYRNPTLAEAMKILGFVERFGIGLQIVDSELRKNGNPEKEFQILPNFVQVTVRRKI